MFDGGRMGGRRRGRDWMGEWQSAFGRAIREIGLIDM
jgi:hypothetical protein